MDNQVLSLLLVAQFVFPFLVLCLVLIWVLARNRKVHKEAARRLILNIKNNEESEKLQTYEFMHKKLSLSEAVSKKQSNKIIKERKFLFRNLISGLLDKNMEALVGLENDMHRIVSCYHNLEVQTAQVEDTGDAAETSEEDLARMRELEQEVKSLKHEVHITLTTLNNIFGEFSSMFGEEVPDTELSVDQIITAMESFSGKNSAASPSRDEPESAEEDAELDAAMMDELDDLETEPDEVEADLDAELDEQEIEADALDSDDLNPDDLDPDDIDIPEPAGDDTEIEEEALDFSLDKELDDIDSALDELELGQTGDDEPSWDEAFEESGDKKPD